MGDGIEGDEEALRQRQRHRRLFARLKLHQVERHSLDGGLDVLRNHGARAPKDLPHVFGMGQRAGIMRADAADSRINRERDLDQLIESRFVILHAERTEIVVAIEGLQGRGRFEHAAAARTEHVPGHVEEAEPSRMDERADHRLLVEPALGGEGERVDAVQRSVRSGFDGGFQRGGDRRLRRLPQEFPERRCFSHRRSSVHGVRMCARKGRASEHGSFLFTANR